LNVLPDEFESTVTPPELFWVTEAEFVLLAVAAPDPAVADEVPLLTPLLSFIAEPPVFPVALPDESPSDHLPMSPSPADPFAHWPFSFSPLTVELASL